MEKKLLTALAFTLFSGMAFAAPDNSAKETSKTAGLGTVAGDQVIPFEELDTDGDGVLTKEELEPVPAIADNFDKIEFDGDGIVQSSYYAILSAIKIGRVPALPDYEALDINKDGTVSVTEYDAFKLALQEFDELLQGGEVSLSSISTDTGQGTDAMDDGEVSGQSTSDSP